MKLFNWFKSEKSEAEIFKAEEERYRYSFHELYSPELLEWIGATNDPVLLACASHLINTWDWPDYLPKPNDKYDIKSHGWRSDPKDYKSIFFTQDLMKQLDRKAEMLSPGLSQNLWLTQHYRKYSTVDKIAQTC